MKRLIIPILIPMCLAFFTADMNAQSCCASKSAKVTQVCSKKADASSQAGVDNQKASVETVAVKGANNHFSSLFPMVCCSAAGSKASAVKVKGEQKANMSCEELCKKMGCDPAKCTIKSCEELCKKMGCDPADCDPKNCKMVKCEKKAQL